MSHIQVIIHKLYKSKCNKTKLTDLRTTMVLNKSKSHQTQSIRRNSVHKLLFDHVQSLETQCYFIIVKI